MAINSINTTSTSSLLSSQRKNVSGLASGMDTDELVKGMTLATRTKIAKQKQSKQLLSWQGEAMRGITDKLTAISQKFTSFTSSTNLLSRRFFERTDITTQGANASKVSASGIGNEQVMIARVKQLAADATVSTSAVSGNAIVTSALDLSEQVEVSNIEGKSLQVKYGGQTHTVTLGSGRSYGTAQEIADSLNELMKSNRVSASVNLSDRIKFEVDSSGGEDKLKMSYLQASDGNNFEILSGDGSLLQNLGLQAGDKLTASSTSFTGKAMADYNTTKTRADLIGGTAITFNLNGTLKTIKLPTTGEMTEPDYTIEKLAKSIQNSLNTVYGAGRIKVGIAQGGGNKLEFYTTDPKKPLPGGEFDKDTTSILKIADGDSEALKGLGLSKGSANRINLDASIGSAGFAGLDLSDAETDANGHIRLVINGTAIEGIKADTTVRDLMDRINASDANVKVSYLEMADKFVITSKIAGAGGQVEMPDQLDSGKKNLAAMMFGEESTRTLKAGQDAELSVKYQGTDEEIALTRSSNSFVLEGMTVTLNGTFGYKSTGEADDQAEAVGFKATADATKIADALKSFVEEYNSAITLINKELTTKRDRNYAPLTDEQRESMSEKEIENWEKKAKEGLLFNNSDLRALSSELRFIFGSGSSEPGISVSSNYADNGKLVLDTEKLKEAIRKDPDKLRDFFAKMDGESGSGAIHRLKSTLDKYVRLDGADKGILVNRAGANQSPLSLTNNALSKQITAIDKVIAQLTGKLQVEENRYYKQFTNLEKLVSKMNAQSSYLMQQFGQR